MKHALLRSALFMKIVPYLIFGLGLAFIYLNNASANRDAARSRESGKTIRVYTIATNCFLAVPADQRTNDYIHRCYSNSESIVGTKVQHFGGE